MVPNSTRYLIIGAGIHGLSTAYHLALELKKRGLGSGEDILVIDKSGIGAGASGIACGVVRNNYFQPAMRELMAHNVEVWESDPWGRAFAGLPTDKSGDMAWVQHMVKSMAPGHGRMGVVLPQGALFRGGVEGKIRQHLLENDLIEAVIGLAPNLFYGTGLAACILVLRTPKPANRSKKVLIVDASTLFRKERAQNEYAITAHGRL